MSMLNIPFVRQSKARCGPASLKMVLGYYGIEVPERKLARLAHCTLKSGTSASNLLKAAKASGLAGTIHDDATISMLRTWVTTLHVPVIVDWFSEDEGHYSVVVGVTRTHIVLHDPERGPRRRMDLQTFQRVWFDFPGSFIRTPHDLILRRMIVLIPPASADIKRR